MTDPEEKTAQKRGSVVSLIPRLARFLWRVLRDGRTPWTAKAALAGLALYLAMPFDIIPDWIPGIGYLDDLLIAGLTVRYLLAHVPREVIRDHWGEDTGTLERFTRGKDAAR